MSAYILSSGTILRVARDAAERAEDNSNSSLVALVFSVVWLEALLNEIIHHAFTTGQPDQGGQMERIRSWANATDLQGRDVRLGVKLQVLATALSGKPMDRGSQPYQDFDLLISLRNALVHQQPEQVPFITASAHAEDPTLSEKAAHKLTRRLASRGVISRSNGTVEALTGVLLKASVAKWAFNTVTRVARHLLDSMEDGLPKKVLLIAASNLTEIPNSPPN